MAGADDRDGPDRGGAQGIEVPAGGASQVLGPLAYSVIIPLLGRTSDSAPDPEMAELRARIAEQRETGEWEAWFVDLPGLPDHVAEAFWIPRSTRQVAVPNLRKLYSAKVCKRMLRHPENWEVVEPLFNRWVPSVVPLIRIGALLEDLGVWPTGKLVDDLQSAEGFAGAVTELEVWAALIKGGYRVHREPLGPSGKRPDFGVAAGGRRHVIEVKTLLRSDGEGLAEVLRTAMATIANSLSRNGQTATISATATVRGLLDSAEGRQRLRGNDGHSALKLLGEECDRLDTLDVPVGNYGVADWFTIEVAAGSEHPLGTVRCGVWDGQEENRRAVRLASVIEGALEQIPPTDAGVVLVALGEPIDVKAVTDELSRRTAARPVFFSTLAFVVLRWKVNAGMRQILSGAILPHGNAVSPAALRLARVLVAGTP